MRDSINLLKRPVQVVSNNVNFLHLIVVIIDLYKNVNNLKNIFLLRISVVITFLWVAHFKSCLFTIYKNKIKNTRILLILLCN